MKRIFSLFLILLLVTGCQPIDKTAEETQFLMDTVCTIRAGGSNADTAIRDAFAKVKEIQDAVNYYDESSTVSQFNRAGAGEVVPLDTHTAAILETALEVCRASEGAFDITIAPVSSLWPFHGEETPTPPTDAAIQEALELVNWEYLKFDRSASTLTKTVDGVAIDLGGAAKGYAADCAAQVLQKAGVSYALLNFGGNVYTFGKNPSRKDGNWQVGIQKPFADSGTYTRRVSLTQGAVVTSGTYQRNFTYEGRLYHHILDPKTGYPTEGVLAGVTIQVGSALLADCLSTACLVLGEEQGQALAQLFGAAMYTERIE
ncbi:MAG: FAD:protein FMN transferase [Clostridia bacterium]|nr:FAD:protein FMN transferase [Clostridia bacterium]